MAGETLGTIRGQMILDVKQALASYTATRQAHVATVTALQTGAGAVTTAGAAIAGVGTAMVAGFGLAVSAAAEFEKRLDYFTAVSNTTQAEYDAIREKALQLGADTIYSANQIAESFIELGKSGVSARDIIDGIGEGVANLGAAADIPLDTAANIITSAVATFQLGADQAVMVADRLAGAANSSIIGVEDLGVSLKYAGGVAASLGVPFEDVNTALAILGENGIKGSTAGTSLRQVLLGLNGSTAKAKNALRELGIITEDGTNKFYNMDGSAKSLSEVFQILQDATAGMSDQQRTATMQQIFATRALPSLIALTREGAAGFEEMAAMIERTSALDVASKRLDNLAGDIEVLRGNIDTMLISGGSGFQEFARMVVQAITTVVQAFLDLPPGMQTAITAVVAFSGALLVIVGVGGMIAGAILNLIALAMRMAPVWEALSKTMLAVRGAMMAVFAIMARNPFMLVISIILLLVGAFVTLWNTSEGFRNAIQPLLDMLMTAFQALGPLVTTIAQQLGTFFASMSGSAASGIQTAVTWLSELATTVGGALASAISVVLPPLLDFISFVGAGVMPVIQALLPLLVTLAQILGAALAGNLEALPGLIQNFGDAFVGVFQAISTSLIPMLMTIATTIITTLIGVLPQLVTVGVQIITMLIQAIVTALPLLVGVGLQIITGLISAVITALPMLIQMALVLVNGLIQALIVALPMLMQAGVTLITGLIEGIIPVIPLLIQTVVDIIPVLVAALVTLLPMIVEAGILLFTGLITALIEALPLILAAIVDAFPQILAALISMLPMLIQAGIQLFLGLVMALVSALPQILAAVIAAVPKIISALLSMLPLLISGAIQLFVGIVTGLARATPQILAAVIKMIPQIVNALVGAVPQLANAGVQLIQGLINGIGSMAGALWNAAQNIASSALNAIKGFFGIKSPSRLMAEMGVYMIQGLVKGIDSMENAAVRTVEGVADSIASVPFQFGSLADTYKQLADTSDMYRSLTSSAPLGVEAARLMMLADGLEDAPTGDTNINVEINNPEPEPASESLPGAIRKVGYLVG